MSSGQLKLSKKIEEIVQDSIKYLSSGLSIQMNQVETHKCLVVSGLNSSDESREAIAKYLVGLRAQAVQAALKISVDLFDDTPEGKLDLVSCVESIVGSTSASLTQDKKEDERNPWIAEGIWHLCMFMSTILPDLHPSGHIQALDFAHVKPKDHGMDGLALYTTSEGNLGLTIIESKAYKNSPNKAIKAAVQFFREVEQNHHSDRIRLHVNIMRTSLPEELQPLVSGMFWTRTRSYIPNPHYDSSMIMNWGNKRPSFKKYLSILKENMIIMPHIIDNFDDFFEDVANKMRMIARGI